MDGSKNLLITFGCSWTYGVGVGYEPGMTEREFKAVAWEENICNAHSFRGILSQQYNFSNINFSLGGSSNQRQFRQAKLFFGSPQYQQLRHRHKKILVLWGITSLARYEMFDLNLRKPRDFFLTDPDEKLCKTLLQDVYDQDWETSLVATEMRFWDQWFADQGVQIIWFDTFNHLDYPAIIKSEKIFDRSAISLKTQYEQAGQSKWPSWEQYLRQDFDGVDPAVIQDMNDQHKWNFAREIEPLKTTYPNLFLGQSSARDLLSLLCQKYGKSNIEKDFHSSFWTIDSNRVEFLVDKEILNKFSHHPTRQAHVDIAEILAPEIEKRLLM